MLRMARWFLSVESLLCFSYFDCIQCYLFYGKVKKNEDSTSVEIVVYHCHALCGCNGAKCRDRGDRRRALFGDLQRRSEIHSEHLEQPAPAGNRVDEFSE